MSKKDKDLVKEQPKTFFEKHEKLIAYISVAVMAIGLAVFMTLYLTKDMSASINQIIIKN